MPDLPNIYWLSFDSWEPQLIDDYRSPNLVSLLKQGFWFNNIITNIPFTRGSLHGYMSGFYASISGYFYRYDGYDTRVAGQECITFPDMLRSIGYSCFGSCPLHRDVYPESKFDATYHNSDIPNNIINNIKTGNPVFYFHHDVTLHDHIEMVLGNNSLKITEAYRNYPGIIQYVDERISSYLSSLNYNSDKDILIFSTDHGAPSGDRHSYKSPAYFYFEDYRLKVWFAFIFPSSENAQICSNYGANIDFISTFVPLYNSYVSKQLLSSNNQGINLINDKRNYVCIESGPLGDAQLGQVYMTASWGVRAEKWKYILLEDGTEHLVDLLARKEEINFINEHKGEADKLRKILNEELFTNKSPSNYYTSDITITDWSKRAKRYSHLAQWKKETIIDDRVINIVKQYTKQGSSVLDIGCGPGTTTNKLSSEFNVIGIDQSIDMMQENISIKPEIFQVMNAYNLSFPNEFFDTIIASMVFHYCKNLPRAMYEASRVLKQGGLFLLVEKIPSNSKSYLFKKVMLLAGDKNPLTFKEWIDHLTAIGIINIENLIISLTDHSIQQWLQARHLIENTKQRIMNTYRDATEEERNGYYKIIDNDIIVSAPMLIAYGHKKRDHNLWL